jgi:hypothetical protein
MRTALALLLIVATAATANAGWWSGLGRHLGIGWSDGYHAFDQCPPCRESGFAIPPGGYVPRGPAYLPDARPTPVMPQPEMLPAPRAASSHRTVRPTR